MIKWCNYEWLTQERWGQIHPEKSFCWYDPSCVEVDQSGLLHLRTKFNPKYFEHIKTTSTVGIGLVSCTTKFRHGIFEIEAKLPVGEDLWPAFWMYSFDSWPPEIDVIEAYTVKRGTYLSPSIFPLSLWDVKTNLHYGLDPDRKSIRAKKHFWGWKNPAHHFIKYRLEWRPDCIKWYYNDYLVRSIVDPKILAEFNKTTLNVIINNGVDYTVNQLVPPKSDFVISSFTYKSI